MGRHIESLCTATPFGQTSLGHCSICAACDCNVTGSNLRYKRRFFLAPSLSDPPPAGLDWLSPHSRMQSAAVEVLASSCLALMDLSQLCKFLTFAGQKHISFPCCFMLIGSFTQLQRKSTSMKTILLCGCAISCSINELRELFYAITCGKIRFLLFISLGPVCSCVRAGLWVGGGHIIKLLV